MKDFDIKVSIITGFLITTIFAAIMFFLGKTEEIILSIPLGACTILFSVLTLFTYRIFSESEIKEKLNIKIGIIIGFLLILVIIYNIFFK